MNKSDGSSSKELARPQMMGSGKKEHYAENESSGGKLGKGHPAFARVKVLHLGQFTLRAGFQESTTSKNLGGAEGLNNTVVSVRTARTECILYQEIEWQDLSLSTCLSAKAFALDFDPFHLILLCPD